MAARKNNTLTVAAAFKIAAAYMRTSKREGLRPTVAYNWVTSTTEAQFTEEINFSSVGFIRRALREEAVRTTDDKVRAAMFLLRDDVKSHVVKAEKVAA
jgi:hypothetical protein